MGKMFKQAATPAEIEYIRKNNLYGIEQDSDIHTLALANMIMRKDGKSHIIHGDCFDSETFKKLKNLKDTVIFIALAKRKGSVSSYLFCSCLTVSAIVSMVNRIHILPVL